MDNRVDTHEQAYHFCVTARGLYGCLSDFRIAVALRMAARRFLTDFAGGISFRSRQRSIIVDGAFCIKSRRRSIAVDGSFCIADSMPRAG